MNVIRSDEMNAWAMPGGKMAVYTGIVEKLKLTELMKLPPCRHEMTHARSWNTQKKLWADKY